MSNQKKKFIIGIIVCILMFCISIPMNLAYDSNRTTFIIYWFYCSKLFYYPCLMLILGWTIMQGISCVTHLMPIESNWVKHIRILLLVLLGIWVVLLFVAPLIHNYYYTLTLLYMVTYYKVSLIAFIILGMICWLLDIPKLNGSK